MNKRPAYKLKQGQRLASQNLPRARKDGLVLREIRDELLVYDLDRHKAFCLNETAVSVWKRCDGKQTVADVALAFEKEYKAPVDEQVVWLALDQLEKYHLLDGKPARPRRVPALTRRQMVRALGMTAAFVLPAIVVITAPTAVSAQASGITQATCKARVQPKCGGNKCTDKVGTTCQNRLATQCRCK